MKLYRRMRLFALSVGIKQLSLDEASGWQLADHLRHYNHHLVKLRKCEPHDEGLFSRHLVACGQVLSKIAFEASMKGVDVDHDELTSIQREINQYLNTIANDVSSEHIPDSIASGIHIATESP